MDKETLSMASFEEIDKARRLFGLQEFASLEEIKQAYRKKAFLHHPDKSGNENVQGEEVMKSLNQSYELLLEYCSRYKYSFKEEDIGRAYPDDAYLRRYVYDWFEGM
jgi:curved DNA-binding protein CbpA